jgi:transposase
VAERVRGARAGGAADPAGAGPEAPAFPPLGAAERAEQRAGLVELLGDDPVRHGQGRSRWTLAGLRAAVPAFADASASGIWRVLDGHRLRRKRARDHLRSPAPAYREKRAYLATIRARVAADPEHAALLYLDELTYHRQPSVGYGYAPVGSADPRAERSTRSDDTTRVVGALDAHTGRVVAHQQGRIGVPALRRFFRTLAEAYPGRRLYLVIDNWPVHSHPDVLAALEPQESPFPRPRPSTWPAEPSPATKRLHLPIQLVPLPTYASWLNPIEKLWRWLKQDVLHLHRLADDLPALKARVRAFLDRFQRDSPDLLRYVGLAKLPP